MSSSEPRNWLASAVRERWASAAGGRLSLALLFVLALSGCGRPNPSHRQPLPRDVLAFSQLFATHCTGCHGQNGTQGPAPALNDPLFLALTSAADLQRVVSNGRHGTLMPAFAEDQGGPLTPAQIEVLVRELRSWKQAPAEEVDPLLAATQPGNRDRGEILFARACAGCHGVQGQGKLKLADQGQTAPAGAVNQRAFLALVSEDFLRRIVITGRPDLKRRLPDGSTMSMPNYAQHEGRAADFQALTAQDIADLTALLIYWKRAG